jgi:gluconolactonase
MNKPSSFAWEFAAVGRWSSMLSSLALVFTFLVLAPALAENSATAQKTASKRGVLHGPFPWQSKIYPGTEREYWVYVPNQYEPEKPTPAMIVQDGLGRASDWNLIEALERLMEEEAIPVQIGIFVNPGVVPAAGNLGQPRFNRSFEYDSVSPRYAQFLVEEILPEVSKQWNISPNPEDRCLAGASSGAICALNAAWERPDQFRRVFSTIGTFVGLRGADELATLIRKGEPRPLRVFLEDGSNDLNIYGGDWWMANQTMLSALTWAGYDVRHAWGSGGHSGAHGREILADALRWIWKDYPHPITNLGGAVRRTDIMIPGETWLEIPLPHPDATAVTTTLSGEAIVAVKGKIVKISPSGSVSVLAQGISGVTDLAVTPDGSVLACIPSEHKIASIDLAGKIQTHVAGQGWTNLLALPDQVLATAAATGSLYRIKRNSAVVVQNSLRQPTALAASPDNAFLAVVEPDQRHWLSYQLDSAGDVQHAQEYGYTHRPTGESSNDATDMAVDDTGRYYLATSLGIQVFDPLGRVHLILQPPERHRVTSIAFGGKEFSLLYATANGKLYSRQLKLRGHHSAAAPVTPPKPGL